MERPLELWGGLECTVARIGDDFRDQSRRDRPPRPDRGSRSHRRARHPHAALSGAVGDDLARQPGRGGLRLARRAAARACSALGIRPIAGLVPPRQRTALHRPARSRLARICSPAMPRAWRSAIPQIELYTPVNEPLTTARFCGLYGHWYPHGTGYGRSCGRSSTNAGRRFSPCARSGGSRPDAQLVQTDDLGKTFSTPTLAYQAEHENQRRWLTFDLLCGRVDRHHPWWGIFRRPRRRARRTSTLFLEADAAPDIIGINHYLTSERYPRRAPRAAIRSTIWGGNGRHRYADAEAVRMPLAGRGPRALPRGCARCGSATAGRSPSRRRIMAAPATSSCAGSWRSGSAAETVRAEARTSAPSRSGRCSARSTGTSLLTQRNGIYEPGPFDVRGPEPRRTALADAAEALARTGVATIIRCSTGPAGGSGTPASTVRPSKRSSACRAGRLAAAAADHRRDRHPGPRLLAHLRRARARPRPRVPRRTWTSRDPGSVAAALACHRPWAVDQYGRLCPRRATPSASRKRCFRENADGAEMLAQACAEPDIPLVTFSSDLVFDGRLGRPYAESDPVNPTCVYGASKAEAERRVLAAHDRRAGRAHQRLLRPVGSLQFRLGGAERALAAGRAVEAGHDVVSPTYVPDLVHEVLDLLIDGGTGLWHLANPGAISWRDLAARAARRRLRRGLVTRHRTRSRSTRAASERGVLLPPLDSALDRFFRDSEVDWAAAKLARDRESRRMRQRGRRR